MKSIKRVYIGWSLLLLAFVIWLPSGDVIDLIVRQKEVVLGRYSRGHFYALVLFSLCFLWISALCFSKIKRIGKRVFVGVIALVAIAIGFLAALGFGLYVPVDNPDAALAISPNAHIQVLHTDEPKQKRSYPDRQPGYPAFNLMLTTDRYGFRNFVSRDHYPVVAVGGTFVLGSQVSDNQTWTSLLSRQASADIYNLGVEGDDPEVYVNNFVKFGLPYKPNVVLFMIYEGSYVKDQGTVVDTKIPGNKTVNIKKSLLQRFASWVKVSPLAIGIDQLPTQKLEIIGSENTVSGYQETAGWMPVKIRTGDHSQYYAFEPKRLINLHEKLDDYMTSRYWQSVKQAMQGMAALGEKNGFQVVFVYAPSTPRVVLPVVRDTLPTGQLHRFAAYEKADIPEPETFKKEIFNWMENEETIFKEQCEAYQWHCLSLTPTLQQAVASGYQVYYTYDQDWTPDGHRVVATALNNYLMSLQLLQMGAITY